jgi:hypothetical protein
MPVVFEFVNMVSQTGNFSKKKDKIDDAFNGVHTLNYLTRARRISRIMLSQESGSLGLFPSIYFYNSVGKFIEGAFLGMALLLLETEKIASPNFRVSFTTARKRLEVFLVENKVFLTQINRKFGSTERSTKQFKGFFENLIKIINTLSDEKYNNEEVLRQLKQKYEFLTENELDYKKPKSNKFSKEQKTALSIKEEILSQPKCKICGGIIHPLSKDFDHKEKREKRGAGLSNSENLQTVHVFCNNSRDKLEEIGFYKG